MKTQTRKWLKEVVNFNRKPSQRLINSTIERLGVHTADFCKLWASRGCKSDYTSEREYKDFCVDVIKHQINEIRYCRAILSLKGL